MAIIPYIDSQCFRPTLFSSAHLKSIREDLCYNGDKDTDGKVVLEFLSGYKHLISYKELKELAIANDSLILIQRIDAIRKFAETFLVCGVFYVVVRTTTLLIGDSSFRTFSFIDASVLTAMALFSFYLYLYDTTKMTRDEAKTQAQVKQTLFIDHIKKIYDKAAETLLSKFVKTSPLKTAVKSLHQTLDTTLTNTTSSPQNKDQSIGPSFDETELKTIKFLDVSLHKKILMTFVKEEGKVDSIIENLQDVIAYIKDPTSLPKNIALIGLIKAGPLGKKLATGVQSMVDAASVLGTIKDVVEGWKMSGALDVVSDAINALRGTDIPANPDIPASQNPEKPKEE